MQDSSMRLILVSGLSGAGKSVALHALEDMGYYCVDNLPATMIETFVSYTLRQDTINYQKIAIGIDFRNTDLMLSDVPDFVGNLKRSGLNCELLAVITSEHELLRRFGDTKRRHPMTNPNRSLQAALQHERSLIDPIIQCADLVIDTTKIGAHQLRDIIMQHIDKSQLGHIAITLVSFGFKFGVPGDADFVLDSRSLPNPYWNINLRDLNGTDQAVIAYLELQPSVQNLTADYEKFIRARINDHLAANRRYLTFAIGCTGGQHRSVYLIEKLGMLLSVSISKIIKRHDSLLNKLLA